MHQSLLLSNLFPFCATTINRSRAKTVDWHALTDTKAPPEAATDKSKQEFNISKDDHQTSQFVNVENSAFDPGDTGWLIVRCVFVWVPASVLKVYFLKCVYLSFLLCFQHSLVLKRSWNRFWWFCVSVASRFASVFPYTQKWFHQILNCLKSVHGNACYALRRDVQEMVSQTKIKRDLGLSLIPIWSLPKLQTVTLIHTWVFGDLYNLECVMQTLELCVP